MRNIDIASIFLEAMVVKKQDTWNPEARAVLHQMINRWVLFIEPDAADFVINHAISTFIRITWAWLYQLMLTMNTIGYHSRCCLDATKLRSLDSQQDADWSMQI